MADQVTISTFLELRDNLSEGIKKVAAQLESLRNNAASTNDVIKKMGQSNRAAFMAQSEGMVAVAKSANTAAQAAKAIGGGFGSTLIQVDKVIDGMAAIKYAAVGFVGIQAVKSVVKLNEEFENLQLRIAGTVMASKLATDIDLAERKAEKVLGTIRSMAAKLPGEAQEYAGAFAMALPKLLASGMTNLTKAADFVSRYTAVAISNGVDAAQAGRDLMLMLSGRAGLQVKTFTVLSEKIGMTAKDFNRLNAEARRQKVEEALKPYSGLLARASEGFTAKFGELKSTVVDILKLGSTPLFSGVKTILTELNDWLLKNKTTVAEMGKIISYDVLAGLRVVSSLAQTLFTHFDGIWSTTRLIFELWASAKIVNGISSIIKMFTTLRAVITGVKVQSQLAAIAASKITPGGDAAGTPAPGGGGKAASVAGIALQLGLVGYSEYKTRSLEKEFADEAKYERQREADLRLVEDAKRAQKFETAYKKAGFDPVGLAAAGLMESKLRAYGMKMGLAITEEDTAGLLVSVFKESQKKKGLAEISKIGPELTREDTLRAFAEYKGIPWEGIKEMVTSQTPNAPRGAPSVRPEQTFDFRHSRFDIKQEFAEGFDPDRIAVAFANDLGRLGDMKLQASYGLAGGVR